MARNDGVDRTVVREKGYQRSGIGLRERHNERKNESYSNPDIVPERSKLNIHFKRSDASYESVLNHMLTIRPSRTEACATTPRSSARWSST